MALILTNALIAEKNKVEGTGAWLILLELESPDSAYHLWFCRNTEDVTVNGQLYQAFPFEIDAVTENSNGSIPTFNIQVSNIDRVVQGYVEQDANFGSGWTVTLSVISSNRLTDAPEIELNGTSLNTKADKNFVTFEVGLPNPMMIQFPQQRFSSGFCQRTFKDGVGCTYAGADTSCYKTLSACQAKFPKNANGFHRVNSRGENIGLPYLAFSGIPARGIYS